MKDLQEVKYVPTDIGKLKPIAGDQKSDTFFLYFTILTGCLSIVHGSATIAWPSPVLPKLLSNDTTINPLDKPVTTMEISMITGLPVIGAIPGSLLVAPLSDKLGRRTCLHISTFGMILCTLVTAFSTKAIYIIISRSISFMFYSAIMTIMPTFVTEMTEDHNRAKHGCFMQLFQPVGTLYSFIFGSFLNVTYFTLSMVFPSILSFITFFFIPESPFFLLSRERAEDCRQALKKLRSNKSDKEIEIDMNKLYETLKSTDNTKNIRVTSMFKMKEVRIGFILAFVPNLLVQGSGGNILMPFIGPIFSHAGASISGNTVGIMIALLKCVLIFITSLVVRKLGRKPLLLASSIGCGLFMIILTWYFYLERYKSPLVNQLGWLPIATIFSYFISFAIGLGSIPLSLIGEMFITEFRSAATACMAVVIATCIVILTSAIPFVTEIVGVYVCFGVFAINCFLGALFIYFLLPETRGKSLLEIQDLLKNYKFGLSRTT